MKSNNNYGKKIFKKLAYKIAVYSIAFTIVFILLALIGRLISSLYIWQPYDKLYIFLSTIKNNIVLFWSFGIILILFLALKNSLNYIDYVMDASDKLVDTNDELIQLPKDLDILESRLNHIKQSAMQNAFLAKTNEEKKNELIVYLAHDLKTPLTSIIGYLELLNEAPDLPIEQRAKYVKITLDKAYRLEELINEFFEITRFNVRSVVLSKSSLNLKLMFEQIIDEFYPVSKTENKDIIVNCDSNIHINADSDKISRVFNNILKNAISYSYPNSSIYIDAKVEADKTIITIKNKGNTIPKDKLDYIFEKFYRLDEARNTNSGGAGLGLAIAKEIVEAHNGKIFAESQDNTTTFTVILYFNQ